MISQTVPGYGHAGRLDRDRPGPDRRVSKAPVLVGDVPLQLKDPIQYSLQTDLYRKRNNRTRALTLPDLIHMDTSNTSSADERTDETKSSANQDRFQDERPSDAPEDPTGSRNVSTPHVSSDNDNDQTTLERVGEEVIEHAQANPLRTGVLGAGLVAVFSTWVGDAMIGGSDIIRGIAIPSGQLFLLGIIGLAILEFATTRRRPDAWLGVGIALSAISVSWVLDLRRGIAYLDESLGMFTGAIEISIGIGAYLAVLVGFALIYIGYTSLQDSPTPR